MTTSIILNSIYKNLFGEKYGKTTLVYTTHNNIIHVIIYIFFNFLIFDFEYEKSRIIPSHLYDINITLAKKNVSDKASQSLKISFKLSFAMK